MSPSGLIFLVVIAIWAAYFLQHWVRRREQLAIARSVDSFSETMRVLERRAAPAPDLTEPHPRSYAVSPARSVQPQVLVKRAGSAASGGVATGAAPGAAPGVAAHDEEVPALRGPAPLATGRRARGLAFLAAVAAFLVSVPLAGFGVLPWLAVTAPALALAGVLVWMRRGALTEQAARREAARRQRVQRAEAAAEASTARAASARPARSRAAAPGPAPAVVEHADHAEGLVDGPAEADVPEVAPVAQGSSRDLYDLQAVEAARTRSAETPAQPAAEAVVPVGPLVDEDDIPLTWDPVPVPRPTYTMKAVAQRHAPAPVEQGVPPELADAAYDEPVRRVAGA